MQLKSLMVTSNASNPKWLLASKFSNRCSAQCFIQSQTSRGSGSSSACSPLLHFFIFFKCYYFTWNAKRLAVAQVCQRQLSLLYPVGSCRQPVSLGLTSRYVNATHSFTLHCIQINNASYVSIRKRILSAAMAPERLHIAGFKQFSFQ